MRSCVEPEDTDDLDPHLYLFSASCFLEGLVKIGRSHRVLERACQMQESMPFFMQVFCIWPHAGGREGEIHEKLRPFRVEGGGRHGMVQVERSLGQCSDWQYLIRVASLRNALR